MIETDTKPTPIIEYFESLGHLSTTLEDGSKIINHYISTEDELNSLNRGVGLRNISHRGIIELRGKDVLDFLHRISTNSVKEISKGDIRRTIFTNEKGRIIDVTSLINLEDYQLLLCSPQNKSKVIRWIEKYIIMDDVTVTDATGKYGVLELSGPQADSFITLVCGKSVADFEENVFKAVNAEGMMFFLVKMRDLNGELKYSFLSDPNTSIHLVKYMTENKGIFDFNLIGEDAYNIYRIEQGIPIAPFELNDNYNPHEVHMRDFISFTKGCYIGQEVIARLDTYDKVQKLLKGVVLENELESELPINLVDEEGKEAGVITSVATSKKFQQQIGLGYIRKFYLENDKQIFAKNENEALVKVTVKNLPFKK